MLIRHSNRTVIFTNLIFHLLYVSQSHDSDGFLIHDIIQLSFCTSKVFSEPLPSPRTFAVGTPLRALEVGLSEWRLCLFIPHILSSVAREHAKWKRTDSSTLIGSTKWAFSGDNCSIRVPSLTLNEDTLASFPVQRSNLAKSHRRRRSLHQQAPLGVWGCLFQFLLILQHSSILCSWRNLPNFLRLS